VVDYPSPSSKASLSAGDRLGPYEIVGLLDEGGMGVVYRAHDARIKRDVALKIMRWTSATPEQVARFSREAHAAGSLNHPNIIAVYDVGSENGTPFVVTELLEGETLRDKLRHGALPFRRAVEFGVQIANALDAAHRKTIWHRDVKPANVFITNDWRVKLLDFGIAKLSDPDPQLQGDIDTASQTAGFHGTPGYMSPEQVRGETIDHRTDIFSLGAVLYEMFTGKRAFQRETPLETMNAVVHAEPADPLTMNRNLSALSAAVLHRCLEKNKEDRFQTARDLSFQLQQLKEPTTGAVQPPDLVVRPVTWRAMVRAAAWFLGALVLIAAVAMAVVLWQLLSAQSPTFDRLTFSRGRIGAARFTPGGASVVYSLATQERALDIARIDDLAVSPTSQSLGYPAGANILAAHPGEFAVMLNPQYLQGERFFGSLGVGPSGSTPRESGQNIEAADWSSSGELAVVRSTATMNGVSQIEYPLGTSIYSTTKIISAMRVSPNGQMIAFLEDPGGRGPNGTILVVDRNKTPKTLTKPWKSARGLAWSPDGKEIWFTAADDERQNRALHAVTLDRKERLVYQGLGALTLWDIASDGRVLLTLDEERRAVMAQAPGKNTERDVSVLDQTGFQAISRDGGTILGGDRFGLFLRSTDGSSWQKVGVNASADDLAPDGKTVLGTMDDGHKLVFIPQGGRPQPLLAGGITLYGGAWWFPDPIPKRVFFTGYREGKKRRSYVQDIAGGEPTAITPEDQWGIAISPDGKWIAGVGNDKKIPLWPVAGGDPKYLPNAIDGERPVAWSNDGWLWLFRRGQIPAAIFKQNTVTGERQFWRSLQPPDTAGVYSILEFGITPDGKAYAYSYARVLSELYLVTGLK
jgi:WD40 repeat protein